MESFREQVVRGNWRRQDSQPHPRCLQGCLRGPARYRPATPENQGIRRNGPV